MFKIFYKSGHYYSLINDREVSDNERKWYEFNDINVRYFDE